MKDYFRIPLNKWLFSLQIVNFRQHLTVLNKKTKDPFGSKFLKTASLCISPQAQTHKIYITKTYLITKTMPKSPQKYSHDQNKLNIYDHAFVGSRISKAKITGLTWP